MGVLSHLARGTGVLIQKVYSKTHVFLAHPETVQGNVTAVTSGQHLGHFSTIVEPKGFLFPQPLEDPELKPSLVFEETLNQVSVLSVCECLYYSVSRKRSLELKDR